MDWYLVVKTVHILSASILFGTGIGIAFFMFRSRFSPDINARFYAARTTVLADKLFTFPAVILQPISGAWLVWNGGHEWTETWLVATYGIYALVGLCWVPVLVIQARLRDMLAEARDSGVPLTDVHQRLFGIWFLLGWPALIGLIAVFYLMVAKPG